MGNNNVVDVMVHNALQKEAPYTGLPQADYMEAPRGEIGLFIMLLFHFFFNL